MSDEKLSKLVEQMVEELRSALPRAIAGAPLGTFDISAVSKCCQGKCGCNSVCVCHGDMGCGCHPRCSCDDVTNFMDPFDWVIQFTRLPAEELKTILQAAPIIEKVRSGDLLNAEKGEKQHRLISERDKKKQ